MSISFIDEAPQIIKDYLFYMQTVKGKSQKTVDEYYIDLRTFFRFIKLQRGLVPNDSEFENISISDVDLELVKTVTLNDAYEFMNYIQRERKNQNVTRARKCSSLKGYFNYLATKKCVLDSNPVEQLEVPKKKKALPKYLTLEQSLELLNAVDGDYKERDYCILTLFLNCGLRVSEMASLNYTDIHQDDTMRVVGKGNKERVVYLNDATAQAINDYLIVRRDIAAVDRNALFLSSRRTRITREALHAMVKKSLLRAGLDADKYSAHKLRHTAATLMLSNGVDVRTLQELLGHENLNTTQIYTHVDNSELRIAAQANPLGKFSPEKSDK